ncbi:hypothetical protein PP939_gp082 [Rhizobium phage RL38J1]|uniref:Transmembrane protein n=1 Tax=Rhizobium phage RL38J1 TaxID=2663232 RepID=A0A6B9J5P5_9CAUD|nr:hypothetical protein PP939_gp082 [Rhizobium phage RL38J1]QGZ14065.1 hypothetical protein RL38J1_082 [Rhizobium phage RL38J1]
MKVEYTNKEMKGAMILGFLLGFFSVFAIIVTANEFLGNPAKLRECASKNNVYWCKMEAVPTRDFDNLTR